jgi:peroxiredoxin
MLVGRIGITMLCVYLLGVTFRIGGCYHPDPALRDDLPDRGPQVGEPFPSFTLPELSGATMGLVDLVGAPVVLVLAPSLDWSPPTKARLLDLLEAIRSDRGTRVAVLLARDQATSRSATFDRDHRLPFPVLVDDTGMLGRLGLLTAAPDGSGAAVSATFVLDRNGTVRARDTRMQARTWPDAAALLAAARAATTAPGLSPDSAPSPVPAAVP